MSSAVRRFHPHAIAFAVCLGLGGCGGGYGTHTFAARGAPRASIRTLGCMEVWIAPEVRDDDPLIDVHLGNTCTRAVPVDLQRLAIFTCQSGTKEAFQLSDPRGEVSERNLTPVTEGEEKLRYRGTTHAPSDLCADLSRIAPDAPRARVMMGFHLDAEGAYQPSEDACTCG